LSTSLSSELRLRTNRRGRAFLQYGYSANANIMFVNFSGLGGLGPDAASTSARPHAAPLAVSAGR
jgi:hypothetical protein